MNILAIDDNEDILKLLDTIISSKGYNFTKAGNGKDGVKLISEQHFDAILLDLAMPEFSGIDVVKSLKESDILKEQKIIIFTASSATDKEINELLQNEGVVFCVRKPVDIKVLIKKIEDMVNSQ